MKSNKIKDMLNNIEVSEKLDDKILSKTIYKKRNLILQKSIIALSVIIIIGSTGFGIAHADEIVEKVKSLFVTYTYTSGTENITKYTFTELKVTNKKEVNYDAIFESIDFPLQDNQHEISIKELEKELNIKFLTSNKFKNKDLVRIIRLEKNNNKISRGSFVLDYVYKNKSEQMYFGMQFITKYYRNDYFRILEGLELYDEEYGIDTKAYKLEEKNDILNTDLYFYGTYDFTNGEKGIGSLSVSFIYDDVVYTLYGTNTSKTKLLEIINSLHY